MMSVHVATHVTNPFKHVLRFTKFDPTKITTIPYSINAYTSYIGQSS